MQGQFLTSTSINTALTNVQGVRASEVSTSVTATTLPIPSQKQEVVGNTGLVDSTGKLLPDTTKTTTTTDRPVITATPPQLDPFVGSQAGFNPALGANAADLLSDQVNLTYQILNLRMILERSLSDRLLSNGGPRLQAVIGFNVSIDPPRTANDAVAVVEVTLEPETASTSPDGMSLVALMPQEKTYNASNLSTKTRQFGGSAVVKVVQVGVTQRRRGQTFYLYRDTDTVAYERMVNGADKLQFGWMFRPVLGRRSVSPGMRQMFAVVSLPEKDSESLTIPLKLRVKVRTYWKKYDHETQTSYLPGQANRARVAAIAASLGFARPQIFGAPWVNTAEYGGVDVKSVYRYQRELRPLILKAFWRSIGPKSAAVTIQGENFFAGTQVYLGDKAMSNPMEGLTIKSNETIDIITSLEALASGPGVLSGRYGGALPILIPDPPGTPANGVELQRADVGASVGGKRRLKLFLSAKDGGNLSMNQLPKDELIDKDCSDVTLTIPAQQGCLGIENRSQKMQKMLTAGLTVLSDPIVSVNGKLVELPYAMQEKDGQIILEAFIKDSTLDNGTGTFRISWPFLDPARWTKSIEFFDPKLEYEVIRLGPKSVFIRTFNLLGFQKDDTGQPATKPYCWQIVSGEEVKSLRTAVCNGDPKTPPVEPSSHSVSVTMEKDIPDKLILLTPSRASLVLEVPKDKKPEAPAPVVVNQNDSIWIPVEVKATTEGVTAEIGSQSLVVREKSGQLDPNAKSRTIEVQLTQSVTAKAGTLELTMIDKDKKAVASVKVVVACSLCEVQQRR